MSDPEFLKLCVAYFDNKLPVPSTHVACPCAPNVAISTDPNYEVRNATRINVGNMKVKEPHFQLDIPVGKDVLQDEQYRRALVKARKMDTGTATVKVILYSDMSRASVRTVSFFYSHLAVLKGVEADVV